MLEESLEKIHNLYLLEHNVLAKAALYQGIEITYQSLRQLEHNLFKTSNPKFRARLPVEYLLTGIRRMYRDNRDRAFRDCLIDGLDSFIDMYTQASAAPENQPFSNP